MTTPLIAHAMSLRAAADFSLEPHAFADCTACCACLSVWPVRLRARVSCQSSAAAGPAAVPSGGIAKVLVVGNVATGTTRTSIPPRQREPTQLRPPACPHSVCPLLCPSSPALSGKTSVINRFARNKFSKDYQTTIGVDFALKRVKAGGAELNVQLWDIAGQERFAGLSRVRHVLRGSTAPAVYRNPAAPPVCHSAGCARHCNQTLMLLL